MPNSLPDQLDAARQSIAEVQPEDVRSAGDHRTLIDVRETGEFQQGYIPGAQHLSRGFLEIQIESRVPRRDTPITLYCAGGTRSLLAARTLSEMGYRDVQSLAGGFQAWKQQGFDFIVPTILTDVQRQRYARHLTVDEVGEDGQRKLLKAKVLLIGAGGLGSPAALYLAAAGVGTLGIIDHDTVDLSNLQRQVIHSEATVGMRKTESAKRFINELNSDVKVIEYNDMLDSTNAQELFSQYDIVVNGCDNFPTRYLANDVAIFTRTPLVDGGIMGFEGQVNTVLPMESPCYRCRYPSPPPPEEAPSCAEAGVLGVLPGIVGVLQATEVIKLIIGRGEPLAGRLLRIDALDMKFREFRVPRDPGCPVCGENPTITEPIDYVGFCSVPVRAPDGGISQEHAA